MKPSKGHIQTGALTLLLAIGGQYGVTEFIGNTKLSASDRQSIVSEAVNETKTYLKSGEYNNDTHRLIFLELIKSADFKVEIQKLIPENQAQVMTEDDRSRWVRLMRKYNSRFPEDNVWNLEAD